MREIILDTETTGLDAKKGDRVIEIGCIEIFNRIPTGREFHVFINPEREVPAEAEAVHGLSSMFLKDKPLFRAIASPFLEFIANDPLVIHNASFDVGFLNTEFERLKLKPLAVTRIVDTLALARRKHPAGPNSLDALCKRYGIDTSKRTKHGALVDSLLLAEVYVELLGERQAALGLHSAASAAAERAGRSALDGRQTARPRPQQLPSRLRDSDRAGHRSFIETLGVKAVWLKHWATTKPDGTTDK